MGHFPTGLRSFLPIFLVAVVASAVTGCNGGDAALSETSGDGDRDRAGTTGGSGKSNTPGSNDDDVDPSDCIEPACNANKALPISVHAIRLSHMEWERTVRDLLKLDVLPGDSALFPPDATSTREKFGDDYKDRLLTDLFVKAYEEAAKRWAKELIDHDEKLQRILPATATTGDVPTRLTAFLNDFLPKAFRRPVTPDEIAKYVALGGAVDVSDVTSDPFKLQIYWVLSAVLQSPHFLLRIEGGGGPAVKGRLRLTPYETASKLSYTLWGTMPNDELRSKAAQRKLSTTAEVAALAKKMMADPRFAETLTSFHDRLFVTPRVASVTRESHPSYFEGFGAQARQDIELTLKSLVIDNPNGSVNDLYSSKTAYVTTSLAQAYGIDPASVPGINPTTPVPATMPNGRVGILGHVGWLAALGDSDNNPNTILRGVFVAQHVLCLPLGGPPEAPDGMPRPLPASSNADTNRERVISVTKGCGDGCHGGPGGKINPLGFAFENFDGLGIYRTREKPSVPSSPLIDASGSIDALPNAWTDMAGLMPQLRDSARAHACYAAHWSSFLNGSPQVDVESRWLSPIIAKSMAGMSVRELVGELVQQDAFLTVSDATLEP